MAGQPDENDHHAKAMVGGSGFGIQDADRGREEGKLTAQRTSAGGYVPGKSCISGDR